MNFKLIQAGFQEDAIYLTDSEMTGSTGGEIFDILISRILEIQQEKPLIYEIIKNESEQILKYAKQIGHL